MVVKRLDGAQTAADALATALADAGIDMVFGMSGGHTGKIFDALEKLQSRIRTVLVREESLGSVMAEVVGRLRRKPGVVIGQGPWIMGNGLLGTIEAHLSSTPMLLLTDFSDTPDLGLHSSYQSGTGEYGGWDARKAFSGVTKQVFQALEPASAVHATQLAIKHAMSGQPGPVCVIFTIAALSGKVGETSRPALYPTQYYLPPAASDPAAEAVAQAAQAIRAAKAPVIVAGNGVRISNAFEALAAFAEQLGIPVVSTASGKSCIAETHPLALGVIGRHGIAAANACVGEADVVIVVGSKLGTTDTVQEHPALFNPARQTFVQIEIEPKNSAWSFPVEHQLVGDAGRVLGALQRATASFASDAQRESGTQRVQRYRAAHGYFDQPAYGTAGTPIHPQRIIGELRKSLPADAMVTCDAGENRILMMHMYQTQSAGSYIQAAGAGPMGYAIPAALGAKLVYPDRPVVAVCGDGGFAMTMNGLLTALEEDIPIVVLIFNNRALGWVLHGHSEFASTFKDFDFSAIARSMGCHGVRVTEPEAIGPAIREAIAAKRPAVIDVVTSLAVSFSDITTPLLKAAAPTGH